MNRVSSWFRNLQFKERLRLSYLLLIIVPVTLLSIVFFQVASRSILEIAKNNLQEVVKKNVALIDDNLAELQRKVYYCNVDPTVLEVLQGLDTVPDSALLQRDRDFKQLMYQKFDDASVVSANLITERFVFGDNSEAIIPKEAFYQSKIFQEDLKDQYSVVWIPSYIVKDVFDAEFISHDEKFFSIVYSLRPTDISQGGIDNDQRLIDKLNPVMMVNVPWNAVEKPFVSTHKEPGEIYSITSKEGQIVSHTDGELVGQKESFPWLKKIGGSSSGSLQLTYQGKQVIVSYAVSEVTGWIATSVVPVSSLLSKVDRIQMISWVSWLLLFIVGMVIAEIISRRVTRPVNRLVTAMANSGRGDFSQVVAVDGKDELQYLTRKFNDMNEEIQLLINQNYEAEIQSKEAQIQALNLQMNPHFLYNTLNIINLSAIEEGNVEISSMILALSDMLQYTFRNKKELVLFEDEITWLKNYIKIMQIRFEDKFSVSYDIDLKLKDALVPKLLLQQYVENAIQHGFSEMSHGGRLLIRGRLSENKVMLTIQDNGKGMSAAYLADILDQKNQRIGVNNGISRLRLLFGEKARIDIQSDENHGTVVFIVFPYQT